MSLETGSRPLLVTGYVTEAFNPDYVTLGGGAESSRKRLGGRGRSHTHTHTHTQKQAVATIEFTVQGSVHRKYISCDIYTVYLFLENCSTCFGRYLHPSSGAHTTAFTVSGTCQTVTANCRFRGS